SKLQHPPPPTASTGCCTRSTRLTCLPSPPPTAGATFSPRTGATSTRRSPHPLARCSSRFHWRASSVATRVASRHGEEHVDGRTRRGVGGGRRLFAGRCRPLGDTRGERQG